MNEIGTRGNGDRSGPRLRQIRFVPASERDRQSGLLGFASAAYGDLALDGLTVRRTRDGRLAVSWPSRRDGAGRSHPTVRPMGDAERAILEREILEAIGFEAGQS